jgi:hypothetical protein
MSILGDPKGWPPDFNGYVFFGRVIEALSPDVVWAELLSSKLELWAWTTGAAKFQLVRPKTFRDSDRERALSTYQCETSGPQPYWLYVKRGSLIVFSLNNERKSVPNPAIPLSIYWRPDLEHLPHDGVVEQASSPSYSTAEAAAITPSSADQKTEPVPEAVPVELPAPATGHTVDSVQTGLKPGERTEKEKWCDEAEKLLGSDKVVRCHGYRTKVARQVKTNLKSTYELSSIETNIRDTVRDWEKNNPAPEENKPA